MSCERAESWYWPRCCCCWSEWALLRGDVWLLALPLQPQHITAATNTISVHIKNSNNNNLLSVCYWDSWHMAWHGCRTDAGVRPAYHTITEDTRKTTSLFQHTRLWLFRTSTIIKWSNTAAIYTLLYTMYLQALCWSYKGKIKVQWEHRLAAHLSHWPRACRWVYD